MILEDSGVGCSVKALSSLGDEEVDLGDSGYVTDEHGWPKTDQWGNYIYKPTESIYTKKGLELLLKELKDFTGIVIFADCVDKDAYEYVDICPGERLARYLRKEGFKVVATPKYVNNNHGSNCKMWTWYFNKRVVRRVKKASKASGVRVAGRNRRPVQERQEAA